MRKLSFPNLFPKLNEQSSRQIKQKFEEFDNGHKKYFDSIKEK